VPYEVKPGKSADYAVNMVTPSVSTITYYESFWMIKVDKGTTIGDEDDKYFKVKIYVQSIPSGLIWDFGYNYCKADWKTSEKALGCPNKLDSKNGFSTYLYPVTSSERGVIASTSMWTHPAVETGGWITGVFPGLLIQPGDHLITEVGCLLNNPNCNVLFELFYQYPGTDIRTAMGAWQQVYDGVTQPIDIPLSVAPFNLVGQYPMFVFKVTALNNSEHNAAFWLYPRIWR
jgi:hypothetical protein